jgi:hypothetical protein
MIIIIIKDGFENSGRRSNNLARNLAGATKETHETLKISEVTVGIHIGPFLNTSTKRYSYTNLLGEIGGPRCKDNDWAPQFQMYFRYKTQYEDHFEYRFHHDLHSGEANVTVVLLWEGTRANTRHLEFPANMNFGLSEESPSTVTLLADTHGITGTRQLL